MGSPLSTGLSELWQLNERHGLRTGAITGLTLAPYAGTAISPAAVDRVDGPAGLGYAAVFDSALDHHLTCPSAPELQLARDAAATGWWVWAWVKLDSLPASSEDWGVVCKGDDIAGNEYALSIYNNSGSIYEARLTVRDQGSAIKTITADIDTTDWHLIEGWYDPDTGLINVAWDGGTPATSAATGPGSVNASTFHIGARTTPVGSSSFDGKIFAPSLRKLGPTAGQRLLLWNTGAGAAYPFGYPPLPGTASARFDNTGGDEDLVAGELLPLFLPETFPWERVYWANGDDLAALDAEGAPLEVWPERVNKGRRYGRIWVPAPAGGVAVGETAPIEITFGNPGQFSSDNYDTLFSPRVADGDTEALFHFDVFEEVAFDPDSIAGLTLWLKAGALALSDGDPVGTWADSSGDGHDYTEATNRPTFKTAIINGHPVVRFDGTNDKLTGPISSTLVAAGAHTAFIVAKVAVFSALGVSNPAQTPAFLVDSGNYHGRGPDSGAAGTDPRVYAGLYDGAHKMISVVSDTAFHYWTERHDSGTLYLSKDAGTEASVAAGNIADRTNTTKIGVRADGTVFLNGDIAEILVYNTALSPTDRGLVQAYLAGKYGL